jgi:hypothetical protein
MDQTRALAAGLQLLFLMLLAVASPARAVAQSGGPAEASLAPITFTVTQNGSPMGTHRVSFSRDGDTLIVDTAIRFEVKLAFITVFRYVHDAREAWQRGRLIAFDSLTDDDGDRFQVAARATPDGLRVASTGGNYLAPPTTVPSSYWHIGMIEHRRVLDSQSGRMIDLVATPAGSGAVPAGGRAVPARLFKLSGEITGELAYGPNDEWVKLSFTSRGTRIEYVRE